MSDGTGPHRKLSPQQARIAQLIADSRNLSYAEIGKLMLPRMAENTIKAHVREMSKMFDADTRNAYPPRIQILVWVRHLQWNLGHLPRLEELIGASDERDV